METWESEGTDWEDKNPTNVHLVSVFFIFANKTPAPTSSSPQKSNLMAIRQHRRMEARPKNIMTCDKMHNASICKPGSIRGHTKEHKKVKCLFQ